ncbi:molybdenum cofactor guanylyltransferase [Flavihumibacter stibioxidans]|uniref:MobA-like NTP transferase domain-containing protein n=1 Tax=Flavihumibacter stibioxidans TaxID=1834163 RepID=A0ABR7MD28_9BACT|nr:molybdenum cofactor guanylyltransferase [Flavihumibacter stibioxidans]MBC6492935.1 hypothetical protein [Flavihumibacter stibioxidans]
MIAVILCGGESSRMGSDKGLLTLQSDTWARTIANQMAAAVPVPVYVSVRPDQYEFYRADFPESQIISDSYKIKVKGPLKGLLSVHEKFPGEDLLVVACDMPLMNAATIRILYEAYLANPDHDAWIFTNDAEPEPLCAIYGAGGLSRIFRLGRSGSLEKQSMKYVISLLFSHAIPIKPEWLKFFQNFNAPSDLNEL